MGRRSKSTQKSVFWILDQPAITTPYIFNDEIANINNNPKFISDITIYSQKV